MSPIVKFAVAGLFAFAVAARVDAQMVSPPSLTAVGVRVFCEGLQPYVSFILPVMPSDRGRPGMVYVGMRDPSGTAAMFLQGDTWLPWGSGLFPAYSIQNAGLNDQQFNLPLNGNLAGGGWLLYAGYGSLSDDGEAHVRSYIDVVQSTERLTNRKVSSVDPDHYRRSLIQNDMAGLGKYSYINTGVENNAGICQPENGVY